MNKFRKFCWGIILKNADERERGFQNIWTVDVIYGWLLKSYIIEILFCRGVKGRSYFSFMDDHYFVKFVDLEMKRMKGLDLFELKLFYAHYDISI